MWSWITSGTSAHDEMSVFACVIVCQTAQSARSPGQSSYHQIFVAESGMKLDAVSETDHTRSAHIRR